MNLLELKQRVYDDWRCRCWYNGAVIQPALFKPEIRQYGDLRRKVTWEKALAKFHALNLWHGCLDAYTLIIEHFNFQPERWDYAYRFEILDEFLALPGGLDAVRTGLEQLFGGEFNTTTQEKEIAYGLLAMVEEQSRGAGGGTAVGYGCGSARFSPVGLRSQPLVLGVCDRR